MKTKTILSAAFLTAVLSACDNKIPMEENLYPQTVYLVGSESTLVDRDLNIGYDIDTVYASVAVSGSLPTPSDVIVEVVESPESVEAYNSRELGSDDIHYRNPGAGVYSFPQENVVVRKGEVYGTYPILIDPSTLHIDSLYMLALKISSSSQFAVSKDCAPYFKSRNLLFHDHFTVVLKRTFNSRDQFFLSADSRDAK